MPPRRASKRARIAPPVEREDSILLTQSGSNTKSDPRDAPDLPLELLMEIISYFPAAPIASACIGLMSPGHLLPSWTLDRVDVLRALSQVCQRWRVIFYPMLWENLEVTAIRGGVWYRGIADALQRKSRGILKNPQPAQYVRNMRVILSRCSVSTVLPALAHCLTALPNLQTISILFAHKRLANMFKEAFDGYSFPSIETVVLPAHAHHVLRACPSAKKVICNGGNGSQLVSAIRANCKKVEVLEGFKPDGSMMKRIVKAAPNLRSIAFDWISSPDVIEHLSACKKLSHIQIGTWTNNLEDINTNPQLVQSINKAKAALRQSTGIKRMVTVTNVPWIYGSTERWYKTYELD